MSQNKRVLITGDTFPVKEQLKRMGGYWDPIRRGWMVPEDRAKEAQSLIKPKSWKFSKPGGIRTRGGLCTICGDDCGGTDWVCNYQ